jgi:TRAP-type C4-dicarboxylate transport system permease large subunit
MTQLTYPSLPFIGIMVYNSSNWITLAVIILLLLFIVGLIFLYFIQMWVHRFWRYLVYTLTGSALMLFIISAYIFTNNIISRISLNQKSLYYFLNSFLNKMFYFYFIVVLILIVLVALSQIICIYIKNKYSSKNNHNKCYRTKSAF